MDGHTIIKVKSSHLVQYQKYFTTQTTLQQAELAKTKQKHF